MIRYCKIKHCIIGFDRPKICVPLVGRSAEEIIAQADQIRQSQRSSAIDMVELRGDYLDILPDYEVLDRLLAKVAEILPEKVLLFTIRSEAEGGEKLAFTTPTIYEINRHVIEKATADMVDIELFSGAEQAEEMIGIAKEKGVKIIMSNHDFQTTPDASTIVNRLRSMQDLGADVAKIAVMPENKSACCNGYDAGSVCRGTGCHDVDGEDGGNQPDQRSGVRQCNHICKLCGGIGTRTDSG